MAASPETPGRAGTVSPVSTDPDDVCAREPIHIPGSIQPHGLLLGLDGDSRIVVASANVETLLGRPAEALLGVPAADVLGDAQLATTLGAVTPGNPDAVGGPLRLRLPAGDDVSGTGVIGSLAGAEVDVLVHRSSGLQIVELEPVLDALGAGAMSYRTARAALGRITASGDVATLCDVLAGEVHELTGFDRVMVYRFDGQWNGEVVAERCRADLEPYLGLRYPATDIPAQARALYIRNWTRLIADAGYTPSLLVPDRNPVTGESVDLSRSVLRSVSPIHLRYLATMGVHSSMSLSLVIGDRLWGLVACHHGEPHRPSFDARSAAEFLAQVASSAIDERETADAREAARRSAAEFETLSEHLGQQDVGPDVAMPGYVDEIAALFAADAVALRMVDGDRVAVRSFDPSLDAGAAERVADVLARSVPGAPLAWTDELATLDPRVAAAADGFAGALRVDLGEGRWLLLLRHELRRTVVWGGDPTEKVVTGVQDGMPAYGPRESFARWQEVVHGHSAPWLPHQRDTAESLREFVERTRLRRAREQLFVAESLQRALIMPVAPTIPGIELASRYNPSESGILGGDWWDVVPVGGGRYALVVGDVSGHGLDAAATMAQIRTSLRTYLLDGTAPAEALDRLDRSVGSLMRRTIATCAIGVVDPLDSSIAIVGAANLPPVLVRAEPAADGSRVEVLTTATRPPLGVRMAAGIEPTTVRLEPGDTITMFSDGLVERRDTGIDQTMRSLVQVIEANPPQAGRLERWLGEVIDAHVGDGSDDTTVLAARVRA